MNYKPMENQGEQPILMNKVFEEWFSQGHTSGKFHPMQFYLMLLML